MSNLTTFILITSRKAFTQTLTWLVAEFCSQHKQKQQVTMNSGQLFLTICGYICICQL